MKYFCFIIWLAYSELCVHSVFCMLNSKSKDQYQYALVVEPHGSGYVFAKVVRKSSGEFDQYKTRDYHYKLYFLCPHSEDHTLLKIEKKIDADFCSEQPICENAAEPSILQYKVIIGNHQRKLTILHRYDIGYEVDYVDFKGTYISIYKSTPDNHYVLPVISVYTYAGMKLTFAVTYEILTADVKKKLENTTLTYKSTKLFPDKIEQFYKNQESKLREKLGLHYDAEKHVLELGSLVNENDLILEIWKKAARFKINQILIWKNNIEMWRNIQEYARHVGALENSETTIRAGIGEVLTITDSNDQTHEMKWGEGEDTIFIPKLYWLAINYFKIEEKNTTGMVIIMHNEPDGSKNVEKICDNNPCIEKKIWIPSGDNKDLENLVYCCKLETKVLNKLDIKFIQKDYYFFDGDSKYSFPPSWE